MCGPNPRASNGGRIAVLFSPYPPSPSSGDREQYTLFFHESSSSPDRTKAIFQNNNKDADDKNNNNSSLMRRCEWVDLRIEKYGVSPTTQTSIPPLHSFRLNVGKNSTDKKQQKLEFDLPGLDLGVSDTGIVGRQVTLLAEQRPLGVGIVGYN